MRSKKKIEKRFFGKCHRSTNVAHLKKYQVDLRFNRFETTRTQCGTK